MDRAEFQRLQFLALRREIENSLDRVFKIMVGGPTLIPVIVGVLGYYAVTPILMALPMLVIVIALLYLNQWNTIMRCGRYIRTRIEPDVVGLEGWEEWLESKGETEVGSVSNRLVDMYLSYAFYALTAAYYLATTYIAVLYARSNYGPAGQWSTIGVYGVLGAAMAFIVGQRLPNNTTTKLERAQAVALVLAEVVVVQPTAESVDAQEAEEAV